MQWLSEREYVHELNIIYSNYSALGTTLGVDITQKDHWDQAKLLLLLQSDWRKGMKQINRKQITKLYGKTG